LALCRLQCLAEAVEFVAFVGQLGAGAVVDVGSLHFVVGVLGFIERVKLRLKLRCRSNWAKLDVTIHAAQKYLVVAFVACAVAASQFS
tara:strand:- start:84 stop:347 length:264 start_codon:yes stop_codon:yes gene_type:complete